ncbi:UPF0102 protein [Clostridia bacterium]|nr:UPF0102 protein [Clostridia bacterium]
MAADTVQKGAFGESIAHAYLLEQGYSVLEKNFRAEHGEIDIIAKKDKTLVFAEVKARTDDKRGFPAEAVNPRKQHKLRQTAQIYIDTSGVGGFEDVRFDVLEVNLCSMEVSHLTDAF